MDVVGIHIVFMHQHRRRFLQTRHRRAAFAIRRVNAWDAQDACVGPGGPPEMAYPAFCVDTPMRPLGLRLQCANFRNPLPLTIAINPGGGAIHQG